VHDRDAVQVGLYWEADALLTDFENVPSRAVNLGLPGLIRRPRRTDSRLPAVFELQLPDLVALGHQALLILRGPAHVRNREPVVVVVFTEVETLLQILTVSRHSNQPRQLVAVFQGLVEQDVFYLF
jgi:hypothetical protein